MWKLIGHVTLCDYPHVDIEYIGEYMEQKNSIGTVYHVMLHVMHEHMAECLK